MRKAYGNVDAGLWDSIVAHDTWMHPPLELASSPEGVAAGQVDTLVETLRRDGIAVMPNLLPEEICDALERIAEKAECRLVHPLGPLTGGDENRLRFDATSPVAVRYDVDEQDVVASPEAQGLLADESLLAVAQAYLGSAPVLDLVAMWWSAAVGQVASSSAAQLFHFDLDRMRFLKFFVLLTDVGDQNGPHVYVKGSHITKPAQLRRDGRHQDRVVEEAFPGAVATIKGLRGTMFLADTIGLHKGLALVDGHRLMFQMEWATSLFGAPYATPSIAEPSEDLVNLAKRHPEVFGRFELPSESVVESGAAGD
ncbi:MAG: phytanoyl-CoA dioxygenase family protein [Acidimicrobiales bacterium]|nr:phytanoyl-CoA dioxygenase family protein [Acidimicrobiales bacterium]